jgi:hypothetical protein
MIVKPPRDAPGAFKALFHTDDATITARDARFDSPTAWRGAG